MLIFLVGRLDKSRKREKKIKFLLVLPCLVTYINILYLVAGSHPDLTLCGGHCRFCRLRLQGDDGLTPEWAEDMACNNNVRSIQAFVFITKVGKIILETYTKMCCVKKHSSTEQIWQPCVCSPNLIKHNSKDFLTRLNPTRPIQKKFLLNSSHITIMFKTSIGTFFLI